MLSSLAIRNAKRSIRDYTIYLITVTMSFSLIFAFNLISNSKQVLNLNSTMTNFKITMYITSIFIALVIGFLINYTTKFILKKRSKEFGTYELLGINKKDIAKMFILENILLGFIALIISIPFGYMISMIMSGFIMNIFELPELVKIDFNVNSILLLGIYFLIIYSTILFRAKKRIKKMKIYDLLYFDIRNEETPHKKSKYRSVVFILSFIIGIISLILFDKQFSGVVGNDEPSFNVIFICILLIIISIYGVTITLSDFILKFTLKNNKLKYKGNNLFIARTFSSKARSMSFTLGTITVLIALTLITLNISNLFKGVFEYQLEQSSPYDIAIELDEKRINDVINFIKNDFTIEKKLVYYGYKNTNNSVRKILNVGWRDDDRVIKLSDFNKLLKMKGANPISLKEDEYYLNVIKEYKNALKSTKLKEITMSNGIHLKQKDSSSEGYTYSWGSGYGYIVVVPDSAVKDLEIIETHLIVNTIEKTTEEFAKRLIDFYHPEDMCTKNEYSYEVCYNTSNIVVRGQNEAMNKGFITITSFVCFYLALIFVAVVGTILAIQSLSDSAQYKYRYQVLSKLGLNQNELHKIIFNQLIVFFVFPIIYPVIVSLCTIRSMNKIFQISLINEFVYFEYFFLSLFLFLTIYTIYFLATYFGFKKNINKD